MIGINSTSSLRLCRNTLQIRLPWTKSTFPALTGIQVPLSAIAHFQTSNTPTAINHQGQFPAVTFSFNLDPGTSLEQATAIIEKAASDIHMPDTIRGSFQGTAQVFQDSLSSEPVLILTAIIAVYIVLGVLYESYIHPITILSTLPSAGLGALLALAPLQSGFVDRLDHRNHSSDRHREEKRDHDGRFCS